MAAGIPRSRRMSLLGSSMMSRNAIPARSLSDCMASILRPAGLMYWTTPSMFTRHMRSGDVSTIAARFETVSRSLALSIDGPICSAAALKKSSSVALNPAPLFLRSVTIPTTASSVRSGKVTEASSLSLLSLLSWPSGSGSSGSVSGLITERPRAMACAMVALLPDGSGISEATPIATPPTRSPVVPSTGRTAPRSNGT